MGLREVDAFRLCRRARKVGLSRAACGGTLIGRWFLCSGPRLRPTVTTCEALDVAEAV
jgi:hypothetical protein